MEATEKQIEKKAEKKTEEKKKTTPTEKKKTASTEEKKKTTSTEEKKKNTSPAAETKESLKNLHDKLDTLLTSQGKTPDTVVDKKWYESVDSKLEAQRGIVHDVRRKLDEVRSFGAMIARIEDAQKVYEEQLEEQKKSSQAVIDALTSQLEAVNKLAKAQEEEILRLRNE